MKFTGFLISFAGVGKDPELKVRQGGLARYDLILSLCNVGGNILQWWNKANKNIGV